MHKRLTHTIWAMGMVSMFMDLSNQMIQSLLPIFLVTVLGSGTFFVGVVEGAAQAAAMIVRVLSGGLSDRLGKRKFLAVAGYGLAALTRPLFAAAPGAGLVLAARILDRFGKGLRGAPRDALIADASHATIRGAAYGLRQALDSLGACLGPVAAALLLAQWSGNFRRVFWAASVPALISVIILMAAVRDPVGLKAEAAADPIGFKAFPRLDRRFWWVVALGVVFNLARFSEAFLLLRAQNVGVPDHSVPLLLMVMNVAYALSAYPAGRAADRMGRKELLSVGMMVLMVSNLLLAAAGSACPLIVASLLWGVHLGLTQGQLTAMVADAAPIRLRGTAFGLFHMLVGIVLLSANLMAGFLWERFDPGAPFVSGAALCAVALMGCWILRRTL